jgi:hypothetical protein
VGEDCFQLHGLKAWPVLSPCVRVLVWAQR